MLKHPLSLKHEKELPKEKSFAKNFAMHHCCEWAGRGGRNVLVVEALTQTMFEKKIAGQTG